MKILRKPSKKPLVLGGIGVAALLVASLSYYVFAMNGSLFGWQLRPETSQDGSGDNNVNMEPATDEQKQAGQDTKQQTVEEAEKPEREPTTLSVSITSATQSGATLRVRTMIQQVVSGTCTLTLKMGSETVTKTAETFPNASATTCKGFDVPVAELSAGIWDATVSVTAGKATGAATTTVNVEK